MSALNFAYYLASRFQRGKKQHSFISFVSFSSTLGIGLGCFVLIVLLSVMNGFERELETSLLTKLPHAELIDAGSGGIAIDPNWVTEVRRDARVEQLYFLNKASGLLQKNNNMKAVEVAGLPPEYLANKLKIQLPKDSLKAKNEIVLSSGIMKKLSLNVGDNIQLLLPNMSRDLSFKAPKVVNLKVSAQIELMGELNNFLGIMQIEALSELLGLGERVTHIEFVAKNPFDGYQLIRDVGYTFPQQVYMSDWTRTHGHLYQDIQLVRGVVYLVLALVICVASFNILSSLVMLVKEKQKEIAILKTMGAQDDQIRFLFIIQGLMNAFFGATVGTLFGVVMAINISAVFSFFQSSLGWSVLSDGIYFVDVLPSELRWSDVIITYVLAVFLSILATLYPANKAVSVQPASELG